MVLLSGAFVLYLLRRTYQFAQGYMGTARRRELPHAHSRTTASSTIRQKRRFRTLVIVCICILLYWYYSDEQPQQLITAVEEAGQAERWHGIPDNQKGGTAVEDTIIKEETEARPRGKLDLAAPKHRHDDDVEAVLANPNNNIPQSAPDSNADLSCPTSPLPSDILLVIRTGATEALEKLPVHFRTTLRCAPSHIIYSDLAETIAGHPIEDVLSHISASTRARVPDFAHWAHLRDHGRAGLSDAVSYGSGPSGALQNPGWKLDKFKFLPMVRAALAQTASAQWFVFVEPDTYVSTAGLAAYLARFDASLPQYVGKHMYVGGVLFAHGGSGFALSRPAAEKVAAHYTAHEDELDVYVEKNWAGDGVLGKALQEVGVGLFVAWPHFQGDAVAALNFNIDKLGRRPWCYAPVTFHHMRAEEVKGLWEFEMEWRKTTAESAVMRHRDVFEGIVRPQLKMRKDEWDNLSTGTEYSEVELAKLDAAVLESMPEVAKVAHKSFENCRAVCASRDECIQFSYSQGKCSTSADIKLGYAATTQCLEYSNAAGGCLRSAEADGENSVSSGWMLERTEKYVEDMNLACEGPNGNDWVLNN